MTEPRPINVADYARLAEARCEPGYWGYVVGGAGDEVTLRDNEEAFRRRVLRPRMLVDVSDVSARTSVLGTEIALPLAVAPTSLQRVAHPDGEPALARAAAAGGTVYTLSSLGSITPAGAGRGVRRADAPLVPALLVARQGLHVRARGRGGGRRLRGARAHRRPAESRPARARPSQRLQPPGRSPHAEPPRLARRRRVLPRHARADRRLEPDLARPRMASHRVSAPARPQGDPHARGRDSRLRARVRRDRRLQPRREAARRRAGQPRCAPGGGRGSRRARGGLRRRRRSPGHGRRQGARARRTRRLRWAARALGTRRRRRGGSPPRAGDVPRGDRARAAPAWLPDPRRRRARSTCASAGDPSRQPPGVRRAAPDG